MTVLKSALLLLLILGISIGCGSKSHSDPDAGVAPEMNRPSAPAESAPLKSEAENGPDEEMSAVLSQLTQVVRRYGMEQRRVPKGFEELVAAGYLERVPEAPGGKRFAINKSMQVILLDR